MNTQELNEHKKFLQMAIDLAKKNMLAGKGGPFGAVIVKDGKVLAEGFNQVTSSNDPTCHAEVDAIRKACAQLNNFELDGCTIYSSCEPCPMCLGAIYWARPKALYFAADKHIAAKHGFDDKFIYDEIALPYEKRTIKTVVINMENAEEPFNLWDNKESKIEY
ncbi:guanine deaminase [Elusimicrobium simillimum]|uniref:nucleoside deaminase n=1 Tax=Elusimicrobium simillimum TaxID=3143438 RepID=UPI003C6F0D8A